MAPGELRRRIMGHEPMGETPEWVVLDGEIRVLIEKLRDDVAAAARRFTTFDDVRAATSFRERQVPRLRARVAEINRAIQHLNLIVPVMRLQRRALDPDEEVRAVERLYFRTPGTREPFD